MYIYIYIVYIHSSVNQRTPRGYLDFKLKSMTVLCLVQDAHVEITKGKQQRTTAFLILVS